MKLTSKYVFFWHGVFSNWHPSPIEYENYDYDDIEFSNSEQMFMWLKAISFDDYESADKILACKTPREAKDLGRIVKNYDDSKWNTLRYDAMLQACLCKFRQNQDMKNDLLATGDRILVEASPYDKIWGIGMAADHPDIEDESKWKGTNLLGKVLMDVRKQLQ